jgi:hypothetical protein
MAGPVVTPADAERWRVPPRSKKALQLLITIRSGCWSPAS